MASRQELPALAEILLDLETNISRQVTAMLKLKQLEKALQKAAQSQQPDLSQICLCFSSIFKNIPNIREKKSQEIIRRIPSKINRLRFKIKLPCEI